MDDDEDEPAICHACVGEAYLSEQIAANGEERKCSYCGVTGPTYTVERVADAIELAFSQHFQRTPEEPDSYQRAMMNDRESSYSWDREGDPTIVAIENAASIPPDAARDIQKILDDRHGDMDAAMAGYETEFSDEAHYEEIMPDGSEWEGGWQQFARSVQTEARFFSRVATDQLASLFDGIAQIPTKNDRPIVVDAGPNTELTHLFRARVFQSNSALLEALKRPDLQLGAPPSRLAGSGRMNAKGISAFYGATEPGMAIAEVRPPVGSQVAVARFDIVRPLRLLDLTALASIQIAGSIFDPDYATALGRMKFLRKLSGRISRPVMPDDQDFEYLPTQAVADYLATEPALDLDGILFSSVQVTGDGVNVVLFQKASRCEEISLPRGTEVSAHAGQFREDGWEQEYSVYVELPEPVTAPQQAGPPHLDFDDSIDWASEQADFREVALEVDANSLIVHTVTAVRFATDEMPVNRHEWVRREHNDF